jgi:hypothetical protein
MTYVHIDPNLPEVTRSDEELRASKQKDAISANEHRDADFVAAEEREPAKRPRPLLARLLALVHINR